MIPAALVVPLINAGVTILAKVLEIAMKPAAKLPVPDQTRLIQQLEPKARKMWESATLGKP